MKQKKYPGTFTGVFSNDFALSEKQKIMKGNAPRQMPGQRWLLMAK